MTEPHHESVYVLVCYCTCRRPRTARVRFAGIEKRRDGRGVLLCRDQSEGRGPALIEQLRTAEH